MSGTSATKKFFITLPPEGAEGDRQRGKEAAAAKVDDGGRSEAGLENRRRRHRKNGAAVERQNVSRQCRDFDPKEFLSNPKFATS